jgi:hypothetical protein
MVWSRTPPKGEGRETGRSGRYAPSPVRRLLVVGGLVVVPVVVVVVAVLRLWPEPLPALLPAPSDPILPDLAMSPLSEITGALGGGGDRYVQFTASIGNVGKGPFIVHAERSDERGRWRVSQQFDEVEGGTTERVTPGSLVWGGHGHDHWHVQLGASYWLTRPSSTEILRKYAKVGYCFFDQARLPGVAGRPLPSFPRNGCSDEGRLALTMGLSPGWGDPYQWTLPDQRLNVSGLPEGTYRLWAGADPDGWFLESDELNNTTWVDLRIGTRNGLPLVAVVGHGPAGAPPPSAPA